MRQQDQEQKMREIVDLSIMMERVLNRTVDEQGQIPTFTDVICFFYSLRMDKVIPT